MPATTKRKRGNVGKSRNELEGEQLLTKVEKLHYRAFKSNVITFNSAINACPKLRDYIKQG